MFSHSSGCRKSEIKVQHAWFPLGSSEERSVPCLSFPASGGHQPSMASLGLLMPLYSVCLRLQMPFSLCVHVSSHVIRTPSYSSRRHLNLIICKDPPSKQSHIYRFWVRISTYLLGSTICLSSLDCCNKLPWTSCLAFKPQKYISPCSRGWKSRD